MAQLCPKRSECALAHYVGDAPASCCVKSCDSTDTYESENGRCMEMDRYVHECGIDSYCSQIYRAATLGTRFLPFHRQPTNTATTLTAVWANAEGGAWAVGYLGKILKYSPLGWQTEESPTTENIESVSGDAEGVWAVGWNGTILRFTDDTWNSVASPTDAHLLDVWSQDPDNAWAVGGDGIVLRYEHGKWHGADLGQGAGTALLHSVSGNGDIVWVVGVDGVALRRNPDGSWTRIDIEGEPTLTGVWVGPQSTWAVSSNGHTFRLDNAASGDDTWTKADLPMGGALTAVWGDAEQVWAVSAYGGVFVFEDDTWQAVTFFAGYSPAVLLDVWGTADTIWTVGDEGTVFALMKE